MKHMQRPFTTEVSHERKKKTAIVCCFQTTTVQQHSNISDHWLGRWVSLNFSLGSEVFFHPRLSMSNMSNMSNKSWSVQSMKMNNNQTIHILETATQNCSYNNHRGSAGKVVYVSKQCPSCQLVLQWPTHVLEYAAREDGRSPREMPEQDLRDLAPVSKR